MFRKKMFVKNIYYVRSLLFVDKNIIKLTVNQLYCIEELEVKCFYLKNSISWLSKPLNNGSDIPRNDIG